MKLRRETGKGNLPGEKERGRERVLRSILSSEATHKNRPQNGFGPRAVVCQPLT